jgi:hypothetical protein
MPVQGATPQNVIHCLIITPATTQRLSNNIYSTQVGPNSGRNQVGNHRDHLTGHHHAPRPKARERAGPEEILKRHTCPYPSHPIYSANPSTGKKSSEGTSHTPVRHPDTDFHSQQIPSRCNRPFSCHLYQHVQESHQPNHKLIRSQLPQSFLTLVDDRISPW